MSRRRRNVNNPKLMLIYVKSLFGKNVKQRNGLITEGNVNVCV